MRKWQRLVITLFHYLLFYRYIIDNENITLIDILEKIDT